LLNYTCRTVSDGPVRLNQEAQESRWVSIEEALALVQVIPTNLLGSEGAEQITVAQTTAASDAQLTAEVDAVAAAVIVEWSGTAFPVEYLVKVSIDDDEGKTGSLKQGFSLEFQLSPGPHTMTISMLPPLMGKVQALEKMSDVLGRHFRLHIGKPGQHRVVLGYNMLWRGFKISQVIGPG
jgi:hypothetical protein